MYGAPVHYGYPTYGVAYSPRFRPSGPLSPPPDVTRLASLEKSSLALKDEALPHAALDVHWDTTQRPYRYLGPAQVAALFLGGVATAFGLNWFIRGARLPSFSKLFNQYQDTMSSPMRKLAKRAKWPKGATKRGQSIGIYFLEGLGSVLQFAMKNPEVRGRLMAYLGATSLGYLGGSVLGGAQEVWVRQEETLIRANLIRQLSSNFRKSIQYKGQLDDHLRDKAKRRILSILKHYRVPNPEELMSPAADVPFSRYSRYPYEPTHFSLPYALASASRFRGQSGDDVLPVDVIGVTPARLNWVKGGIWAAGMACGLMGQMVVSMMKPAQRLPRIKSLSRVFNVRDIEALFLTGSGRGLWAVLGLTALAKIGKMMVDGYREIEVTRQHANTELRYQSYNWLALDPEFHRIAEEEALEEALQKLKEALPQESYERSALAQRIKTILTNVGRNSAPKYFQMTPPVSLVAARG